MFNWDCNKLARKDTFSSFIDNKFVFVIIQGCIPTIGRAMVVNAAQLASYSQAKEGLKSTGNQLDIFFFHLTCNNKMVLS